MVKRNRKFNIWDVEDPESAGMTEKDLKEMWQYLVDSGMAWQLQGWYGRTAMSLIDSGFIKASKKKTPKNNTDYYGNQIFKK